MINAEAFPLHVLGGVPPLPLMDHLMLTVPIARDAVDGHDEAYTEASLDFITGVQSSGTAIDAYWKVTPDRRMYC